VAPMILGGLHGTRTAETVQPPFEHPVRDRGRGGGLGRLVICHCVLRAWDVPQVQDFEVLFQLTRTEQIGCQLQVVAAALPPNLFYDELGVSFYEESSNP
jgi:hypothetical protein